MDFFETYKDEIGQFYVDKFGIGRDEPEAYAQRVVDEALELEEYIELLIDNTLNDELPDLKGYFTILEGFEDRKMPAMKCYGLRVCFIKNLTLGVACMSRVWLCKIRSIACYVTDSKSQNRPCMRDKW